MPKVSVILSSYNHAKFICESIENTLKQTYADFELIIWDDGSSDNSWELIQRYSDPRIKAFRNDKNIGGVFGVNKAITEVATGEYIAIHHSDDVWELDKLQKQVAVLDANPALGAVFTNTLAIDERSEPLADQSHIYSNIFNQPNRSRQQWLRRFFFYGNALCHPSVLIRKLCYEECGLYQDSLAQLTDFDLWVRLCFKYEIHVLPERLTRYRVRDAEMNASGSRPEVRIRSRSEFHYILKNYLRIGTFDELVAIFPEAEPYRRGEGCVPQFVLAMMAVSEASQPWGKMLGIETLFDLMSDSDVKQRIMELYQFSFRDFTALTGKHDLFHLEAVVELGRHIASRDALIGAQRTQLEEFAQQMQAVGTSCHSSPVQASQNRSERLEDRRAYEQVSRLLETGQIQESKTPLIELADKDSTCWDVYNDLGVQYFNDGDFAKAVPCFEKGMMLEGTAGVTARNYAAMLLATGNIEGALSVWGGILREQPSDAAVLAFVRDVLSNINPIPPSAWEKLVADIRAI